MEKTTLEQVEALLREAGKAHHDAFIAVDGADAEWPLWYAEYLHERLTGLLDARFTKSELVYLLISLDRELQRTAPGGDWAKFYAGELLQRYNVMN